jgi:sugar fermentation stimulation protein A
MRGGAYLLVLRLDAPRQITIGALGGLLFPQGIYVYAGSALASLRARVDRHFSAGKKVHWHIDHLSAHARPSEALVLRSDERLECLLNEMVGCLEGASPFAPGFGCSDCGCDTHLHLLNAKALSHLERFLPERIEPIPPMRDESLL